MSWVKKHRLPFFLRSRLFLEYKLCKLLLRKLKELPTCQSSRGLRGYSRATSTKTLLSPSPIQFTRPGTDATFASWPVMMIKHTCRRPLGSAASLPAMLHMGEHGQYDEDTDTKSEYPGGLFSRELTLNEDLLDVNEDENQQISEEKQELEDAQNGFADAEMEQGNFENARESLVQEKYDAPDAIVAFENDENEDAQTEADVRSITDKLHKTLQELKAMFIGSIKGMDNFKSFLQSTSGIHLFEFWLDAERYKDSLNQNEAEVEVKELRTKLFREIRDKYNTYLTKDARIQIETAVFHEGLTRDLFARTQYDILRRLRSYWIPRFIVHAERTGKSNVAITTQSIRDRYRPSTGFRFLPSVDLVRSLPPRGDWCRELARESWGPEAMIGGGRVMSAKKQKSFVGKEGDSYRQLLSILTSEKYAGGPLRHFLEQRSDRSALHNLLFWQDVRDFEVAGNRAGDRLLRLVQAWKIVKQYIVLTGDMAIALPAAEKSKLLEAVEREKEIAPTQFKTAQRHVEGTLRCVIEDYRREEKDAFVRVRKEAVSKEQERRKDRKDYGKLKHSPSRWYKRHPGSSPSERQRRLYTSLSIAEEIDVSRGTSPEKKSFEQSPSPPKKPKKKKKVKKVPKNVQFTRKTMKPKVQQVGSATSDEEESKPPDFVDALENKGTVTSFKQYVQNMEGRNLMNKLLLYLEAEAYYAILPAKRLQRDQQGMQILNTYFDTSSRRTVNLPEEIQRKSEERLKGKSDRPMTPLFLESQQAILPDIQNSFSNFFSSTKGASTGQNGDDGTPNTPGGLTKGDTNESFLVAFRRSKRRTKQGTGRVQPTKEDKAMFLRVLQASRGRLSLKMEYFVRYLDTHGDLDGFSKAVNNLMFYLEVQKFKELYNFMDELSANRKVEAVVDCFLDSASPPWLQIDISADLAGKITQKAQNFSTTKKVPRDQKDPSLFDEAQNVLFKELLPYWAGFNKQYDQNQNDILDIDLPMLRQEKVLQKRYAEFLKFPNIKTTVTANPNKPHAGESKTHISFSFANGIKWKELKPGEEEIESSIADTPEVERKLPEIAMSAVSSAQPQSTLTS